MTNTQEFSYNETIRTTVTFTDDNGTAADPGTVTAKHKDPSGNVATLTYGIDADVIKQAVGIYYIDLLADEIGVWFTRFEGTGTIEGASESCYFIKDSEFD